MNDRAEDEEWLQSVVQLPNPNEYEAMCANVDSPSASESSLTMHYEDVLHKLDRELQYARQRFGQEAQRASVRNRSIARYREALSWLVEVYELDELSSRVIEHVLTTVES